MDEKKREDIKQEAGKDEISNYDDALIDLTEKAVREECDFKKAHAYLEGLMKGQEMEREKWKSAVDNWLPCLIQDLDGTPVRYRCEVVYPMESQWCDNCISRKEIFKEVG
jgi:hypothetical protein